MLWRGRVEGWARSGMSCKEDAAKIGVNPNTLAGWRHKLRRRDAVPMATTRAATRRVAPGHVEGPGEVGGFVDVTQELAAALTRESAVIELEVGGVVVRLRGQVDTEALARVLGVLEGRR